MFYKHHALGPYTACMANFSTWREHLNFTTAPYYIMRHPFISSWEKHNTVLERASRSCGWKTQFVAPNCSPT